MLLAAVAIGKDFDYVITPDTTVGVMAALTVLTGCVNSLSTYWMEKMTKTYVIFHVCVLISCSVALLALTKDKHDAAYVFTHVESDSGWSPIGFSFLFGFLSVSWTMTDYDATAHITEEYVFFRMPLFWAPSDNLAEYLNRRSRRRGPFHLPCYSHMWLDSSLTSSSASAWYCYHPRLTFLMHEC